ncbi:RidA family protein [Parapedobacter sp. GCM10030251]|uniref:RidA family protein n=1 Tax=Parapedobacter sp. GCM10030251 TaxID=3273419 RepID=UPI00361D95EC
MEKKRFSHPLRKEEFVTGPYSDALLVDGCLYVSGQGPVDFATSSFVLGTIEEETHLTIKNLQYLLDQGGMTLDDVIKCTVHLADINDFDRFNAVYETYFTGIRPVRTTVQSGLVKGIKVEIDCIAKKGIA